ncbi:MAG TPA: hypothetical protein VGI92_00830 [Gemmatimonadales bacterium]|jgi:hypothetical protein
MADYAGRRLGATWFGVLGGPAAWAADELASIYVHEGSCNVFGVTRLLGAPSPMVLLIAIGLAMMGVAAAAFAVSAAHVVSASGDSMDDEITDQRPFLARAGRITSGVFFFGILLRFITVFFIASCRYP